jgi:hypothetical protein
MEVDADAVAVWGMARKATATGRDEVVSEE